MSEHHWFGPSSIARRMKCPASYRMEKDLPDNSSDDAAEGTMLHAAVALKLRTGEETAGLTAEQREMVDACVEYTKIVGAEILNSPFLPKIRVEETVYARDFDGLQMFFGTVDDIIHNNNHAVVIDWKFGRNEVEESANNPQMAAYALAVMDTFDVDSVRACVFQPRIKFNSEYTFTLPEVIRLKLSNWKAACLRPDAPQVAGDHCKYCRAAAICQTYKACYDGVFEVTKRENLAPVAQWTDMELSEFRHKCGMLKKVEAIVDSEIKARCKLNGSCGDYELSRGRKTREVTDIAAAYKACILNEITPEQFHAACKLNIGAIEDAIAGNGMSKSKAEKFVNNMLENCMKFGRTEESLKKIKVPAAI